MMTPLILLLVLMVLGALVALEIKDLLSSIISLGVIGFALTIVFLMLEAPDLAIVQIVVETLTLIILIAAILKTTREDTIEDKAPRRFVLWIGGVVFMAGFLWASYRAFQHMPSFGSPDLRMAIPYIETGFPQTGAANIVAAIILDFRGYDTLGEGTVLFTSVVGTLAVLRHVGRKRT
jgi:multicomponent Na+:H+ antiporter subunit B